jgi:hypothetical protein
VKFLKYILFFFISFLLNINVSAKEIVIVENKNVFFNHFDGVTQIISEEYTWLGLLYLQENSKLVTANVETGLSCNQNFSRVNPDLIDAWEIFSHRGYQIRRSLDALESLTALRNNSNLSSKLAGKTQAEIDVLLGNMKGWSGASYKQVCDKVNLLVDELPANVTGLDKYLGSACFGNGNGYTNRHSWVQLEILLVNK